MTQPRLLQEAAIVAATSLGRTVRATTYSRPSYAHARVESLRRFKYTRYSPRA